MSNEVIIALISGVVSVISLTLTLLIKKSQNSLETNQKGLHKQINSRMDELLALTRASGKQEGKEEEQANPTQ